MEKLIRGAKILALLSFVVGTFIMLLYIFWPDGEELNGIIILIAVLFTYGAAILHVLMILALIAAWIWNKSEWRSILKTIGILSLNLPVVVVYGGIIFYSLTIMRITFVNERKVRLTHIKVDGCEAEDIGTLEPGASVTKWIDIPGDCQIDLHYQMQGEMVDEVVQGYVSNGMGRHSTYVIDGKTKPVI